MTTEKQEEVEPSIEENEKPTADQQEGREEQSAQKQEDQEVTILASELDALRGEKASFEQRYWLALADAENARKRMVKERDGDRRYAVQEVILDLLQPIDQLDKALGHSEKASDEVRNWAIGFKMILTQMKDALVAHGVKPFHSEGEKFDPHRHEAVETVETETVSPDTVVEELLKGYTIGDKILRPARVRVSKLPSQKEENEKQEEN